jgi:hypothetical protein
MEPTTSPQGSTTTTTGLHSRITLTVHGPLPTKGELPELETTLAEALRSLVDPDGLQPQLKAKYTKTESHEVVIEK